MRLNPMSCLFAQPCDMLDPTLWHVIYLRAKDIVPKYGDCLVMTDIYFTALHIQIAYYLNLYYNVSMMNLN